MRAIEYTHTGPADVLQLVDKQQKPPAAGEVSVRIAVSGVNPTDWKSRQGTGNGAALPVPQVPNQDGSGTVVAVGDGVTDFSVGDRVWVFTAAQGRPDGTAEEIANLPADRVVLLPDGVSFDIGASLGVPALTAHRALTARDGGPERLSTGAIAGVTVLVAGGAGAVGHAAIQLAVWAGATVVTTISSPEKALLAEAAGAQHVINYRTEDVASRLHEIAPDGADIIVEVNALANLAMDLDLLAVHGTISIYAATPTDVANVPLRAAMVKNARLQFLLLYVLAAEQRRDAVEAVSDALRDGALGVGAEHGLPITRFPLERTADAHRAVEQDTVGKVLIDVSD